MTSMDTTKDPSVALDESEENEDSAPSTPALTPASTVDTCSIATPDSPNRHQSRTAVGIQQAPAPPPPPPLLPAVVFARATVPTEPARPRPSHLPSPPTPSTHPTHRERGMDHAPPVLLIGGRAPNPQAQNFRPTRTRPPFNAMGQFILPSNALAYQRQAHIDTRQISTTSRGQAENRDSRLMLWTDARQRQRSVAEIRCDNETHDSRQRDILRPMGSRSAVVRRAGAGSMHAAGGAVETMQGAQTEGGIGSGGESSESASGSRMEENQQSSGAARAEHLDRPEKAGTGTLFDDNVEHSTQ